MVSLESLARVRTLNGGEDMNIGGKTYTGVYEEGGRIIYVPSPACPSCGGDSNMDWKYCHYCGGLWEPTNGREI